MDVHSDFQTMGQDMARYDELRESVIKQSRGAAAHGKLPHFTHTVPAALAICGMPTHDGTAAC